MDPRRWNDDTPPLGYESHESAPSYPRVPRHRGPAESPRPGSRIGRYRSAVAVAAAFAVVLGLGTVGWIALRPGGEPVRVVGDRSTSAASLDPGPSTVTPTTAAPTTTSPKPSPKRTTARPRPRPTPTQKPPAAQKPPPPPSPVPSSSSCTQHPGPDASKSVVSAALAGAGARDYWNGVVPPAGAVTPLPPFQVEARLMDAFAWTESSWQSTVIACDGGIGLMQLMPDNVTFLNQRFDTNFDVHTVSGNTALGATYIEWLTAYFGTYYFGSYDLMNATAPIGTGGVTLSLLDVVIAAYNVGPDAVEDTHGTADGSDDTLSIPNSGYVTRVHDGYSSQPWL